MRRQLNLIIHRGEYVVLCDKSGSGKTTRLRHQKSVLTPYSKKSVEIHNKKKTARKANITSLADEQAL